MCQYRNLSPLPIRTNIAYFLTTDPYLPSTEEQYNSLLFDRNLNNIHFPPHVNMLSKVENKAIGGDRVHRGVGTVIYII